MLTIHNQPYDIRALVFDKDGTLLNINTLWRQVVQQWIAEIQALVDGDADLASAIATGIGMDAAGNLIPNGAVAVASTWKIAVLVSGVLYQHGIAWEQADHVAQTVIHGDYTVRPSFIEAVGDVAGKLHALHAAGIKIVVATSDHRAPTLATLPLLGIDDIVEFIVCGNDSLPNKPAPEVMAHISATLGIDPKHIAMVGDSDGDMLTGKNGNALLSIGVTDGGGDPSATADVLIHSVDELLLG